MIVKYSYGIDQVISSKANVIDQYKQSKTEEIRADLQKHRSDIVMILQHVNYNINIGSVIRSNNAFLGKEVYIVGRRRYDKRGCAGTYHYENVYYSDNLEEVIEHLHSLGYIVYAVDNIMQYNPKNLLNEKLPQKSAFVFGEEGTGLLDQELMLCDDMIYVQMYGSVRSLNVACCASIIEFEYARQWRTRSK